MAEDLKKTASSGATAAKLDPQVDGTLFDHPHVAAAGGKGGGGGGSEQDALVIREWDGGLCDCCGSPCTCCPGWGICGLVFCSFSSCLFGLNQKRAFGASSAAAVAWAVLFFSLSSLFGLIAFGVDYASKLRCLSSRVAKAERLEDAAGGQAHAETFAGSVAYCSSQHSTAWTVLTVISAVAGVAAIGLGAYRRVLLRERFSIRGSAIGDFCAWLWCSPCALCQETRTLELRGVRDGEWLGADPLLAAGKKEKKKQKKVGGCAGAANAATVAPAVQEMPSKVV